MENSTVQTPIYYRQIPWSQWFQASHNPDPSSTPLWCEHLIASFSVRIKEIWLSYRHLCNVDTWLYHTDVCMRRFDCKTGSSVMQKLGSVSLVSVLGGLTLMQTPLRCGHLVLSFGVCIRRSNCKTDSSVMWTLSSVSLVSVSGGSIVIQTPLWCGHLVLSLWCLY